MIIHKPPTNVLDFISASGREVIAVGKINDIFVGQGITAAYLPRIIERINRVLELLDSDFEVYVCESG